MSTTVKREIALVLSALGILVLVGGGFLAFIRGRGLSSADATAALANLAEAQLDRVAATDSLAMSLVVPDTPQWVRIRQSWGAPDFLIAGVTPAKSLYCISKLPVTIAVMRGEEQIPTEPAGAPYGYSSECSLSSRRFNAAPGAKLTILVTKNGTEPLLPGELIVVASWLNTKDRLAGIGLDKDFRTISTAAIAGGLGLISLAVWLTWRRPV